MHQYIKSKMAEQIISEVIAKAVAEATRIAIQTMQMNGWGDCV